jgi:hypothetical protein
VTWRRALQVFAFAVVLCGGKLLAGQSNPVLHVQGFGGTVELVGFVQRFEASTPVEVTITRFSTDDERDRFVAAGIPGLAGMPVIGEVKVAGNPAYAVRYAQRRSVGSDSILITLVTDRIVVVGSGKPSTVQGVPPAAATLVSIVSLGLDAKNKGGGSLCGTRTISYDPTTKRISGGCDDPNHLLLQSLHQVTVEGSVNDHW